MKKLFLVLGTVMGLQMLLPAEAGAQEPVVSPVAASAHDTVTMNLNKVLEVALTDNPSIIVAEKTIETKRYAKKETITGLFPTASLSATGTKNVQVATMAMAMGDQVIKVKMGRPYNYSGSITAALPLVVPQLWKAITVSEEQVQLAVEQARESKINTIAQVKTAYYSLLLARDSYEALLAAQRTAETNVKNARLMYEVGSISEYDKLQAEVQLASIKPNLLSVENGIKLAEMNLKVLMGVDVNEPLKFEGKLSDYEEQLFADLMKLKENTDLTDNSTLRQLDANARLLRMSETINKLGYLPTVALALQAGYSAMPDDFNPFDASYYGSVGLTLSISWTLFDGMQKYMKTKQNKLAIESLEIQRENVARQLELAVTSSLNGIETAAEQVVSNRENIYAAERAYGISQKRYEAGSGTMLELTASESSLLQARLQYVQAIYDFLSNRANLEQTLGKVVVGE